MKDDLKLAFRKAMVASIKIPAERGSINKKKWAKYLMLRKSIDIAVVELAKANMLITEIEP